MTKFFQAQLTDDLSDIDIPCSGAQANELWQTPPESNRSSHLMQSTVSVITKLPTVTPLVPRKSKPEIAPKPVMGVSSLKRGNNVDCMVRSTKSAMRVLFQECRDLSTDSDDIFFTEPPNMSPLNDQDDGLVSRVHITHNAT